MKKLFTALFLGLVSYLPSMAQQPSNAMVYGPISIPKTMVLDSTNVNKKAFNNTFLLDDNIFSPKKDGAKLSPNKNDYYEVPGTASSSEPSVSVIKFDLNPKVFTKGNLNIYGSGRYALFVDNKFIKSVEKTDSINDSIPIISHPLTLIPGNKSIMVKALRMPNDKASAFRILFLQKDQKIANALAELKSEKPEKWLTLHYMMNGKFLSSVSSSPNGQYTLLRYQIKDEKKTDTFTQLRDRKGKLIRDDNYLNSAYWSTNDPALLYDVRTMGNQDNLVTIDPSTGKEEIVVYNLPDKRVITSPSKTELYYYKEDQGPKKDDKVIRRLDPDDRQPNWRKRSNIYRYDIHTGISTPITFGYHSVSLMDINDDGSKLLIGLYTKSWDKFPYNFTSIVEYDAKSGKIDTLITKESGVDYATYIPQTDELLVTGSANAFNGIGNALPNNEPANDYDKQLFRYHIKTKNVIPLTKNFDPNIGNGQYDKKNKTYIFNAENGSRKSLYKLDLKRNTITMVPTAEDVTKSFTVAENDGAIWYIGQSTMNADRAYRIEGRSSKMVWDLSAEKLKGYTISKCESWNYVSADGTTIEAWYYLPPNFDAKKKYPMLVYYYGGTSPTLRTMEGTYSLPMFAAMGYVVLTLNPSGTTGYGQAFAARHLNAWGDRTADDIIGATKTFAEKHSFVNIKKIGCFGASYGGFMTQYLQTKTDLFAAAISHAGISSISNYWAGGFWGIGYSAVASYKSYPWNNPDLYVKHSPLFNADKIHTPLLLLHGSVDTNVPTSESVNLYNALKVLGRTVEMIEFTGQDHFVLEHDRKIAWTNAMYAWFAKWLQDDSRMWDELYPPQPL